MKRITVLYNKTGTSTTDNIPEADEDTYSSAVGVAEGLSTLGYQTTLKGISPSDIPELKKIETDLVFNVVEWSGRDSEYGWQVIEELESAGIPFTGSGSKGYKLSCDKILMKREMDKSGIPTPKWQVLERSDDKLIPLPYPVILKPAYEHCAIGISQDSLANNETELRVKAEKLIKQYCQPVIAEEFVKGLEAHVTVLEKNGMPWVLPPAVIRFKEKSGYLGILTYESKWKTESWEANMSDWEDRKLDNSLLKKINKIAVDCYTYLGGRSYPRVDTRIRGSDVYVLEINNNPGIGFDPESGITYSAKKAGLTWETLLQNIVTEAKRKSADGVRLARKS